MEWNHTEERDGWLQRMVGNNDFSRTIADLRQAAITKRDECFRLRAERQARERLRSASEGTSEQLQAESQAGASTVPPVEAASTMPSLAQWRDNSGFNEQVQTTDRPPGELPTVARHTVDADRRQMGGSAQWQETGESAERTQGTAPVEMGGMQSMQQQMHHAAALLQRSQQMLQQQSQELHHQSQELGLAAEPIARPRPAEVETSQQQQQQPVNRGMSMEEGSAMLRRNADALRRNAAAIQESGEMLQQQSVELGELQHSGPVDSSSPAVLESMMNQSNPEHLTGTRTIMQQSEETRNQVQQSRVQHQLEIMSQMQQSQSQQQQAVTNQLQRPDANHNVAFQSFFGPGEFEAMHAELAASSSSNSTEDLFHNLFNAGNSIEALRSMSSDEQQALVEQMGVLAGMQPGAAAEGLSQMGGVLMGENGEGGAAAALGALARLPPNHPLLSQPTHSAASILVEMNDSGPPTLSWQQTPEMAGEG